MTRRSGPSGRHLPPDPAAVAEVGGLIVRLKPATIPEIAAALGCSRSTLAHAASDRRIAPELLERLRELADSGMPKEPLCARCRGRIETLTSAS